MIILVSLIQGVPRLHWRCGFTGTVAGAVVNFLGYELAEWINGFTDIEKWGFQVESRTSKAQTL